MLGLTLARRSLVSLVLALSASWASSDARATEDAAAEKPVAFDSSLVRIAVLAQPREVELPSRFNVAFRFLNGTAGPVTFRHFALTPLEEPGGLEVGAECGGSGPDGGRPAGSGGGVGVTARPPTPKQVNVGALSSFLITCQVKSKGYADSATSLAMSILSSWSLLTFQPGDYRFVATVEARQGDGPLFVTSETLTVRLRPAVWQICAGASLGALLLVVFSLTSTPARSSFADRERLRRMGKWRRYIGEPLLLWLGATVSASIFIFLTYRLKDISSPFTVTVNDFYGGLVIGLFGVFLADYLAGRLFSADSAPDPASPASASAEAKVVQPEPMAAAGGPDAPPAARTQSRQ